MSEREFLELLNLYLDREITPADADRLEREIRADASRHRTYLQYCRMQQAVRLLGTAGDIVPRQGPRQFRRPERLFPATVGASRGFGPVPWPRQR